jgi:hypothetical protein
MPDTFGSLVGTSPTTPSCLHPQRRRRGQLPPGGHPRVREGDTWRDGEASFFRVSAWRDLAEHAKESLTKAPAWWSWAGSRQGAGRPPRGSAAAWSRSRPTRSPPASCG